MHLMVVLTMSSSQLTVEDIYIAESWLKNLPDANDAEPRAVVNRLLKIGLDLTSKDLSRKDLVTYLRMQMGIIPKSEKLPKDPPSNQRPGAAIFRR